MSTNSVGSENNRKVVIFLTDKKSKPADDASVQVDVADVTPDVVDIPDSDTVSE